MRNASTHWDAEKYSRNSAVQYGITMSALAEHVFVGDERVVDIGCGDGKITYQLALKVPRGNVVGIDNSEDMIRFAQTTYSAPNNLSFVLKDVQYLDYRHEFDVAVSAFCLQWVPDKSAAFRGMRASLKPGGKAILVMPFRNRELANLRKQMIREGRWKRYFVNYVDPSDCADDVQYETYAREVGLAVKSYTIERTVAEFPTEAALTDFLSTLTPHLKRLPDEHEIREFMEDLVRRYLEIVPPTPERRCEATYVYVCARMVADSD